AATALIQLSMPSGHAARLHRATPPYRPTSAGQSGGRLLLLVQRAAQRLLGLALEGRVVNPAREAPQRRDGGVGPRAVDHAEQGGVARLERPAHLLDEIAVDAAIEHTPEQGAAGDARRDAHEREEEDADHHPQKAAADSRPL